MTEIDHKTLPAVFQALLQGQLKTVIWGARRELTVFEWQRQVPAEFMVDLRWEWWNARQFHGMPVYAPGDIGRLDPAQTVVINHYYASPYAPRIEAFLQRLGGYRASMPLPLHEMARLAAKYQDKTGISFIKGDSRIDRINGALHDMLTPPDRLAQRRDLPEIKELSGFFGAYRALDYLEAALPALREESASMLRPKPGHIALMIHRLGYGGSERQICNLAVELKKRGYRPTLFVYEADVSDGANRQFLSDIGVPCHILTHENTDDPTVGAATALSSLTQSEQMALWHVRAEFALGAALLHHALHRLRPEALIVYGDRANMMGGIGGMMAGVPKILLSGLNMAPPQLPDLYGALTGSFHDVYPLLLRQEGITLSNNSAAGAAGYAAWLDKQVRTIPVVRNCVAPEFSRNLHPALAMAKRVGLGLRRGQPLILGVFRLSPEKRPLDFVRIIAVLRKKYPSLRAVICGDGPMRGEVQRLMRRLKLETVIFLPGFVTDIPVWLRSADLLLHTSSSESLPTVLLEAQAAGLPVVCTDTPGGGSAEALADTLSPFMSKVGDIQGLAASCAKLLRQKGKLTKPLQKQMRRDYSPARMAQQSLRIMGLPHHMVSARKRGRCV